MSNFFFQAKKKEAKRHRDTCDCVPSPATLKVSEKLRCVAPLNAFWVSELINARFLTVGTVVPDCPNKMAAGASPRPTKEVVGIWQNEIILFMLYYLLLPENTI